MSYKSDREFEDDVRRIADALFDLQPGDCKAQTYTKGKKQIEIDGVARERHVTHLVMATTSTKLSKVKEDVERLGIAAEMEEHRGSTIKKWMILEKEPEGPHVSTARAEGVALLTFRQFKERFFDGRKYLSLRKNASFGSARDPSTDSRTVADDEFIEPPMVDLDTLLQVGLDEIVARILRGEAVVLVGPFGSGKSLTLREVWFALRRKYLADSVDAVPVAVNLREHWGAEYADEILRRHSRSIGFERESDLTVAWRAGMATLLVDGFDELASQGVAVLDNPDVLHRIRLDALVGVRDLLSKSPDNVGLLVTGRDHYFDDRKELVHALGLQSRRVSRVRVDEFDDDRARKYLHRKGASTQLPDWLPRKALLLGYLTRQELLGDVLAIDGAQGQATAWHRFLELICRREADPDRAVMDHDTVQRVLEHLAIQVRSTTSGVGPISASMLAQTYSTVTGQFPGDAVLMQLQRLPGLTERDAEPGSRSFVDHDLLEALQGVALARHLLEGLTGKQSGQRYALSRIDDRGWYEPMGSLAAAVAAVHLRTVGWTVDGLRDFIRQYRSSQFGADLLQVAMTWSIEDGLALDLRGIELEGIHIASLDLDELAVSGLSIRDSLLDRLVVGTYARDAQISIANSHVTMVVGAGSREHLPSSLELSGKVEIDKFDALQTTEAIVRLDVDSRLKALLAALKKLYRQRGGGRVAGAFRRGLPADVEQHIGGVLKLLVAEGFAWRLKDVFHPVRQISNRAHQLLDNPHATSDPLVAKVLTL